MRHPSRPSLTADFAGMPFRVGFQRGVGYVVCDADTLHVEAGREFDGDPVGYRAAYELAADLNLERAEQEADSAAALAEAPARPVPTTVVPNSGIHLQSYTVAHKNGITSPADLCQTCADKTPNKTKWSGELVNGFCDGCGAGPSVSHYRVVCELCGEPAELVGEQWTCGACAPVGDVYCEVCGAPVDPADAELVGEQMVCYACASWSSSPPLAALAVGALSSRCPRCGEIYDRLGRCGCDYRATPTEQAVYRARCVALGNGPDDEPPPPAAGARVLWRWEGTADALGAYLDSARKAA